MRQWLDLVRRGAICAFRYLKQKSVEGAEIHNHAMTQIDDRYARNWYFIRGGL